MITTIHSINLPKIVQIGWGHHVDFCAWKNRPLLLAKGVDVITCPCPNIMLEPLTRFRNGLIHAGGRWLKSHCIDTTFPRKPLRCYRNPTEGHSTHDIWNPTWIGWLGKTVIYYSDVIMGTMASQITSLTIVYSTIFHLALLALVEMSLYNMKALIVTSRRHSLPRKHLWPYRCPMEGRSPTIDI